MSLGRHSSTKNLITTIRIANIRQLFSPIILLAIACFLLFKIPFRDVLTTIPIEDITTISSENVDDIKQYDISHDGWLYSGYDNYSDKKIDAHIFYKLINEQCYFLLVPTNLIDSETMTITDDRITVIVRERTKSFDNFLTQFAVDINWNFEALNETTSSIIFDTVSYNTTLYKIVFIVLMVIIAFSLISIAHHLLIAFLPLFSRQFGKKHRHCNDIIKSRFEFAAFLQAELDDFLFKADELYVTKNYVINLDCGQIHIIPVNKLCFIFEHGNMHKVLWFYMKVTHTMYFLCSNSLKCHFIHKHSGNIDYILNMLKQMIPNLMVGYSTENQLKYIELVKEYNLSKKKKGGL